MRRAESAGRVGSAPHPSAETRASGAPIASGAVPKDEHLAVAELRVLLAQIPTRTVVSLLAETAYNRELAAQDEIRWLRRELEGAQAQIEQLRARLGRLR